ncbi:MAG: VOC family protein [Nocardioides sp.]|nr:VOC family protein [Nocardioides sp.]
MDPRISLVTLAVADLGASRAFYLDGLGWTAEVDVPDEVVMIRTGEHLLLSLWSAAAFEVEVGPLRSGPGLAPFTLAHNVATQAEVDEVLALAARAGADLVQSAVRRSWGGYAGYFADPDGFRWEVAHNPGPIADLVLAPRPGDPSAPSI